MIVGIGRPRIRRSVITSMLPRARYMFGSFRSCTPSPVQFSEMGQAWKSVVKKNAVSHRVTMTSKMLAAIIKLFV